MRETDVDVQQKNFEQLAGAKRYYGWFADLVMPYVGKRILEIGCGQGNISEQFLDRGITVHGIDLEEEYVKNVRERFKGRDFSVELADITKKDVRDRLAQQKFDTIICVNVIEHIKDDDALTRYMYEILTPGGSAILLAPAHKFLMSNFDDRVGHYRRYTRKSLSSAIEAGGLRVVFSTYFNALGAAGWLVLYKWMKKMEPGSGSVTLLETLVPILKTFERVVPMPFGLSAIAVGTKPRHE